MANETIICITGNTTADGELRFTRDGVAVVNFTVASTPRVFDRQANEWKDGDALFMRCTAWKALAEHVAACVPKGTRVVVSGRLKQTSWETKEGERRTGYELEADDVALSIKFDTAYVSAREESSPRTSAAPADVWNSPGTQYGDEAPF